MNYLSLQSYKWIVFAFAGILSWSLPAFPSNVRCDQLFDTRSPIRLNDSHFPSSAFGLVHAERPGQNHYSKWSAETANAVISAIQQGKRPSELFAIGAKARQEFARDFEGVEKPEEDFGSLRFNRSRHIVGEDILGVSSVTLSLSSAKTLPKNFDEFPNPWWKNISHRNDRTQLANQVIANLRNQIDFITPDRNLLIVDRHYVASTGEVYKSSSTKLLRAFPEKQDSPYFVSTLNVPKPEIAPLMEDVYRRIDQTLWTKNKSYARAQLRHAMYAFFNAMPYYRGSGAIGRTIFTALFSYVEGRAVTLHPESDVKALAQTQAEYLQDGDLAIDLHSSPP